MRQRRTQHAVAEDKGRAHKPVNDGRRGKEMDSSLESLKGSQPC